MLKEKMWHRKGTEQKQKMKVSGLIFRDKKVKREKELTSNSRKSSKIKGFVTHPWKKKQENRKRRKEKWQKEKNRRCLLQFVGKKNNIFSDTSKQEGNKCETECWKEDTENKKGELRQKRETISQDTEKQYKAGKINVKHVQQRRETDKIVFVKRRKQKKKAKETIQDQEKKKIKNSEKKWKKREYTARQEREQVDRGWTKGGNKEAK